MKVRGSRRAVRLLRLRLSRSGENFKARAAGRSDKRAAANGRSG